MPLILSTWNHTKENPVALKLASEEKLLDAIEHAINKVENDPNDHSVGYGGFPDRDGQVTLDACIMDHQHNAGSVSYLQHIKNPISVARKVMEKTPHVMLVGEGAYQFAINNNHRHEELLTDASKKAWQEWLKTKKYAPTINSELHDTIGMLAVGPGGNIAGGCSTSGLQFKMNGRVGDSPIIGAGLYVDNEVGAATATGMGELVLRTLGSFLTVELMRQGMSPQEACEAAVLRTVKKNPDTYNDMQVGYIAVDKKGNYGAYSIQPGFVYTVTYQGVNEARTAPSYI